jgi:protein SCO1
MLSKSFSLFFLCTIIVLTACQNDKKLPFIGSKSVNTQGDSVYHQIGNFAFLNQDSVVVSERDYAGKIYIADFFFTTCPTICPKMKTQLLRVYKHFENDTNLYILSHTIDPQHDNVSVLRAFAKNLKVSSPQWNFVTGDKAKIYAIAQKSYFVSANEDAQADGGFVHSGAVVLIDRNRRIRGIYDGTKPEEIDKLIADIPVLEAEK